MYKYRSTEVQDLVNNNLAILDPKPHLYTLFTHQVVSGGFIAGVAWIGTTCYGRLKELFGENLSSTIRDESQRSSINVYANTLNDMEVAEVYLNIFFKFIIEPR